MKYLHWAVAAFATLVLAWPASARKTVIPVETEHTQLVLVAQENGVLQTVHFGAKIADPSAFACRRSISARRSPTLRPSPPSGRDGGPTTGKGR